MAVDSARQNLGRGILEALVDRGAPSIVQQLANLGRLRSLGQVPSRVPISHARSSWRR